MDPVPDPDSSPQCDGDIIDQDLVQDIASSDSNTNLMQISTRASSASAVGTCGSKSSSQETLLTQAARSASHFPLRTPLTDA
eukprot:5007248-Pyramimonas_sp.AAC.1